MTIDLSGLVRPHVVEMTKRDDVPHAADFRLQPLERGFGHTLGNALRRMLLSSLRGSAVWAFRLEGVVHEHQTIPGVVEDIHQIIQRLKSLTLVLAEDVEEFHFVMGKPESDYGVPVAGIRKDSIESLLERFSEAGISVDTIIPDAICSPVSDGQWTVVFKRSRDAELFSEKEFLPITFSVWDGFYEERGAKRGITSWYNLYIEPTEKDSPLYPMLGYGLGLLLLEILLIRYIRRTQATGSDQ